MGKDKNIDERNGRSEESDKPMTLYKYLSLADKRKMQHAENMIVDSEIYFSSPDNFNDPFDCKPLYGYDDPKGDRLKVGEGTLQKRGEKAVEKYGVLSLCADKTNLTMWSHYSDSHKGICLEFTRPVAERGDGPFVTHGGRGHFPREVSYKPKGKASTIQRPRIRVSLERAGGIRFIANEDSVYEALCRKAECWEYEDEYRVIIPNMSEKDMVKERILTFRPKLLTGVILGARITPADKKRVCDWVRQRNDRYKKMKVLVERAKLNKGLYRLDFPSVDISKV